MSLIQGLDYLQPSQGKGLYSGNYIDFTSVAGGQWAQQFLPDVYDKEVEIYGNRTISGFLKMVSAEMPSTSDQIIWLEQGRLHTRYTSLLPSGTQPSNAGVLTAAARTTAQLAAGQTLVLGYSSATGFSDVPGTSETTDNVDQNEINFRVGQTVMIARHNAAGDAVSATAKGVVTVVSDYAFSVALYTGATIGSGTAGAMVATDTFTALAYGSEFAKGTGNFTEKIDPSYSTYTNAPIIMKEHYAINGSDTGQIGWIEVTSENGASGYLWYVKAEHENRLRWEDYIEMSMVEGVKAPGTGIANTLFDHKSDFGASAQNGTARGTEGFFSALETRGNLWEGLAEDLNNYSSVTGTAPNQTGGVPQQGSLANGGQTGLLAFDEILKTLDKNGSIEENMLYVNRNLALAFDNFMSQLNTAGNATGTSWGVFNNSQDMALNLGFSGFRRGSYDFYKTDWKYLNDYSTRGGFQDVQGVMIPAGTSTVYDQNLGKNIKRPFLHVRYRASETDNRKMKSWITGSVGGAYTTDVDEMRMHYLTERCLITQGANNFFLFKQDGATV